MVKILRARVKLYKSATGRKTPFVTGYRPIFKFENQHLKTSGQITLIGRELMFPGEEADVEIRVLDKFLDKMVKKGTNFFFSEGGESIGEGIVFEIR